MDCTKFLNSSRRVSNSFSIIFTLWKKLTKLSECNHFSKEPRPIYSHSFHFATRFSVESIFSLRFIFIYQVFAKFALSIYYFHQCRSKVKLNLFHFIFLLFLRLLSFTTIFPSFRLGHLDIFLIDEILKGRYLEKKELQKLSNLITFDDRIRS